MIECKRELFFQVYKAPLILEHLAEFEQRPDCSRDELLLISACITRISYARKQEYDISEDPRVKVIVSVATGDASPLPESDTFKMKGLFAATGSTASAHWDNLSTTAASTAVAKWPVKRHENDTVDFRAIDVVPIVAELKATCTPLLPCTDGSDQFLISEVGPPLHLPLRIGFKISIFLHICALSNLFITQAQLAVQPALRWR